MQDLSNVRLRLVQTIDDVLELRRWLGERRPVLGVDTETGGLDFWREPLRTVQFGDAETGWCLDARLWLGPVKEMLEAYKAPVVFHNFIFDMQFLTSANVAVDPRFIHDTRTMAHLLDPTHATGLKPLSARLIHRQAAAGAQALKTAMSDAKWTWRTVPTDFGLYWKYAALDPVLTARLYELLKPQVDASYSTVYELEIASQHVLRKMARRGALVDRSYCRAMRAKLGAYLDDLRAWLNIEYGLTNPGSDAQVVKRLHADGLTWDKKTEKGAVACDREVLQSLDHPLAGFIVRYRDAVKLDKTYLRNFDELADTDDILHASVNPLGAKTGRMSISRPSMQNLPRSQHPRNAIVARKDNVLVLCDYSQIEMRLLAHFAQEPAMLEAIRYGDAMEAAGYSGYDVHSMNARAIFNLGRDEKVPKDKRSLTKNCVPLSTEILTSEGWRGHDQVKVGDLTLTHLGWQPVLEIFRYEDADLYRVSNENFEAVTTLEHRWLAERRKRTRQSGHGWFEEFTTTGTFHPDQRLVLAPPCSEPVNPIGVTPREAALIAWAVCDGGIRWSMKTPPGYWKRGVYMEISQAKPQFIRKIEALVRPEELTVSRDSLSCRIWRFKADWARDLLRRADLETGTVEAFVLRLTSEARAAFIEACLDAEGHDGIFGQNEGDALNAMRLAWYLEGSSRENPNATHWGITANKRTVTTQRLKVDHDGWGDVWCVRTEAGTWTMRQEHRICITGNSGFAVVYGAGLEQFCRTAGVAPAVGKSFLDLYYSQFPGVKRFQSHVAQVSVERARDAKRAGGDEVAWVKSPVGRRHPCEVRKIYKLVNYLIQGTAADVFKQALVNADNLGLADYLILPVHDEVIADVPKDEAEEYGRELVKAMENRSDFAVPLTVDKEEVERWGEKYVRDGETLWLAPDLEEAQTAAERRWDGARDD